MTAAHFLVDTEHGGTAEASMLDLMCGLLMVDIIVDHLHASDQKKLRTLDAIPGVIRDLEKHPGLNGQSAFSLACSLMAALDTLKNVVPRKFLKVRGCVAYLH